MLLYATCADNAVPWFTIAQELPSAKTLFVKVNRPLPDGARSLIGVASLDPTPLSRHTLGAGGAHGRQGQVHFSGPDHRHHRVRGERRRDLDQYRVPRRLRRSLDVGLHRRLAGGRGHGVHRDPIGAPADAAARPPHRPTRMMLAALDLARRIEAGTLDPAAVVDRCAT